MLPEEGTLLTGDSVLITEGMFKLRAVCVIDDLHSDEFSAAVHGVLSGAVGPQGQPRHRARTTS